MKCNYCKKTVKGNECRNCDSKFELDYECLCFDGEHFCDHICVFEYMINNKSGAGYGNIEK